MKKERHRREGLGRTARNQISRAESFSAAVLVLVFGGVDEVAAIRSRSSCTKLDKFGVGI